MAFRSSRKMRFYRHGRTVVRSYQTKHVFVSRDFLWRPLTHIQTSLARAPRSGNTANAPHASSGEQARRMCHSSCLPAPKAYPEMKTTIVWYFTPCSVNGSRQEGDRASHHRLELRSVSARHAVLAFPVPIHMESGHRSDARSRCDLVELVRAHVDLGEG